MSVFGSPFGSPYGSPFSGPFTGLGVSKPKTLGARSNVELSTETTSRKCYIPEAGSYSIDSGEISLNGGTWGAGPVVASGGDYIQVRVTSSGSYETPVVVNVSGPSAWADTFTVTTRAEDTIPAPFEFTALTDVEPSTAYASNSITVTGIDASTTISITGGNYRIDGGSWVSTSGTVNLDQTVELQVTSGTYEATATATVTIGGVDGDFSATTRVADTTPDAFTFTDVTDVEPGSDNWSNAITISGIEIDVGFTCTGAYRINGGITETGPGTVSNGDTVELYLLAGTYEAVETNTLNANGVSDTYSVTTRVADTTPNPFSFTDQTDVTADTLITSNTITPDGYEIAIPIEITAGTGQYSVDGGSYTSSPGTISPTQTLTLQQQSDPEEGEPSALTISINGVTSTWTVTTESSEALPTADLVALYEGTVDSTGTVVQASEGNRDVAQVAGNVIAGDGTMYGVTADPANIVASGGALECRFIVGTYHRIFINIGTSSNRCYLGINHLGRIGAGIGNQAYSVLMDTSTVTPGSVVDAKIVWDGSTVTLSKDGQTVYSGTQDGVVVIDAIVNLLRHLSGDFVVDSSLLWAKIYNDSGEVVHQWSAIGTGLQTREYDQIGDNHITWQSVTGSAYAEDDEGFDLNILGWTVADGSTIYANDDGTGLITSGYRLPPGVGYLANGDPAPTTYVGPIAADKTVSEATGLQGDGTLSLSGDFLTNDTFVCEVGSVTCTTNGTVDIANTVIVKGIDQSRGGSPYGYFPMQDGATDNTTTNVQDILGGNDATIQDFTLGAWVTVDNPTTYAPLQYGYTISGSTLAIGDPSNPGYLQDGTTPTDYQPDAYDSLINAPCKVAYALGPLSQKWATIYGDTEIDLTTASFNVNTENRFFVGTESGIVLYSEEKDAAEIAEIAAVIGDT